MKLRDPSTADIRRAGLPRAETGPFKSALRIALLGADHNTHVSLRHTFQTLAKRWLLQSYRNGEDALARIPSAPPDAVLIDVWMPGLSGITCTRRLRALVPGLPVIVYTARLDEEAVRQSLRAGARGYVVKPASPQELVRVIASVVQGWPALCPFAQRAIADFLQRAGDQRAVAPLTRREEEILLLEAHGLLYKEIAAQLHLSEHTVNNHLYAIRQKLGVHTAIEAINRIWPHGQPEAETRPPKS